MLRSFLTNIRTDKSWLYWDVFLQTKKRVFHIGVPVFGLGIGAANLVFMHSPQVRSNFTTKYEIPETTAYMYTLGKSVVYSYLAPIVFLHALYRGYCVYVTGDVNWVLPTIMPGWSKFVRENPEYRLYSSVQNAWPREE